jgi:phage N-6-adenine-methyltransferase
MSLIGFKARNHPQQKRNPKVDDRATTPEVFDPLDGRFRFTVDVAASPANTKCERFYTMSDDGLAQSWARERVWCNPPYSDIRPWVEKAWDEWRLTPRPAAIVMLLPANRTEQAWWQDLVEPHRRQRTIGFSVEFLRGRLRFIEPGDDEVRPNSRPPFGCCLLIWSLS